MFKQYLINFCLKYLRQNDKSISIINKDEDFRKKYTNQNDKNISSFNINNIIIKKDTNIPKQIFYICVGQSNNCFNYTLRNCKYVNSNFKINVLKYTYDEFFRINDVYNILKNKKLDNKESLSRDELDSVIDDYKFKILYTYGGIYLGNYTFCIKEIDSYVLEKDYFCCTCIRNNVIEDDYSMFGVNHKSMNNKHMQRIYPPLLYNNMDYESMKMTFYNKKLSLKNFKFINKKMCSYIYNFYDKNYQ